VPTTTAARERLAIALDTGDLDRAIAIARAVQPHVAIAKVGLELFSAAGRDAVAAMRDLGMTVFLDVKLHDIPNTVGRAATVLGALGARFLTLHARVTAAASAGCAGVICAAADLDQIKRDAPRLLAVTPGIRPSGVPAHDQGRPATPGEAIRKGADVLVLGRAVTAANNPADAAIAIAQEVEEALRATVSPPPGRD
jgi:orotidine-5'-phosphate decarboxylase